MLFTHFGVSGPLVLTASTYLKKELSLYHMEIDLKPALDAHQLEQRILRDFEKNQNRDFFNSLSELLPPKADSDYCPLVGHSTGRKGSPDNKGTA